MSKIYRYICNARDTIINLDNVNMLYVENEIVTFNLNSTLFKVSFNNKDEAKEFYEKIFTYWNQNE